jgi:hypothetical protein
MESCLKTNWVDVAVFEQVLFFFEELLLCEAIGMKKNRSIKKTDVHSL